MTRIVNRTGTVFDIDNDDMIPVAAVPERVPPNQNGKPISRETVRRWHSRGLRGVLLETARIGHRRFTSAAELKRFLSRVAVA